MPGKKVFTLISLSKSKMQIISLVQNEEIVVQIVLRNNLDFDLDVSSFVLWFERPFAL